jgi:hypothetical protein
MTGRPVSPDALIEAYVLDVIRRLPSRLRNDVGFELRVLLAESLKERATGAGRLPDEAMALDLVREFGRPDEVAERYHPPGPPIIPPAHARGFVWATVIGLAVQWAGSLPLALSGELNPAAPESSRFSAWWLSYGLGAFWWPGFLVCMMMITAWVRRTWPAAAAVWKPKAVDRDHVSRPLYALGLAAALCGIALWVLIAWSVTTFDNPFTRALAFDEGFLETRAPILLLYWAAGITLLMVLIIEGRWRDLTRRIDTGMKLAACVLMAWFVLGGRIFVTEPADQTTKGALVLIILLILAELAFRIVQLRGRIRPPEAQRSQA